MNKANFSFKALLTLVVLGMLLLSAASVFAADITVDEDCSLENAILSAHDEEQVEPLNSCEAGDEDAAATDTITIDITGTDEGTIVLSAVINITSPIAIEGGGFTISGDDAAQVFAIDGASVTISNLTVTQGSSDSDGGAITVSGGALTLSNSVVSNSAAAGNGGGIYAANSDLTLTNSAVSGNSLAEESEGSGGGIYFSTDGTNGLIIEKSGLDSNTSPNDGGGLYINAGTTLITNATFGENTAAGSGGGIYNAGTATLTHVTVANNTAETGGGIHDAELLHLYNSILSDNTGGDCSGTLNSNVGNLIKDGSCGHDEETGDPQMLELAGMPIYYVLQRGSPAINSANVAYCLAEDQRGIVRTEGACDMGASEYEAGAFAFQISSAAASAAAAEAESDEGSSSRETVPPTAAPSTCESPPTGVTVTGFVGGTQCQERDSRAVTSQIILDYGFKRAIDIWGYVPDTGVTICFQDTGVIILLDAGTSPREIVSLANTTQDDYRCAFVDRAGLAILMPSDFINSGHIQDAEVTLSNCRVTTTDILNLRNAPAGDQVLYVILNNVAFDALARTSGWFQVNYYGTVGWISADYVTTAGTCQ